MTRPHRAQQRSSLRCAECEAALDEALRRELPDVVHVGLDGTDVHLLEPRRDGTDEFEVRRYSIPLEAALALSAMVHEGGPDVAIVLTSCE
jgi:hypothetical protein